MKKINFLLFLAGIAIAYFSCTPSAAEAPGNQLGASIPKPADAPEMLLPGDYVSWVEDMQNGLKVEKTIEDFTYTLQYKPLEYLALMELKKDSILTNELEKTIDNYSDLQYYTFRISAPGEGELLKKKLGSTNEYYHRIQYYSFEMQKDLKLIDGKDTLDCALFHFERVYGLAPYATFVLGFPPTESMNNKTLFYNEKVFGTGKIYLTVQLKNYKKLPLVITS
ncbi:MAG: hypothetical protein V4549_00305 [Bacteroidota bacterium]